MTSVLRLSSNVGENALWVLEPDGRRVVLGPLRIVELLISSRTSIATAATAVNPTHHLIEVLSLGVLDKLFAVLENAELLGVEVARHLANRCALLQPDTIKGSLLVVELCVRQRLHRRHCRQHLHPGLC